MQSNHLKKSKLLAWLGFSLFMIALMIIVGGMTRLADAGLSITQWQVFSGIIPPLNDTDFAALFTKYQQIPEFKEKHFYMDLADFKYIFWFEYIHRILGRITVLTFLLPLIFFGCKSWLTSEQIQKFILILLMFLFQGFLGWFMVSSGLTDRADVSHIRLAIHLLMAFILSALILWEFLKIKHPDYFNNFQISNNKKLILSINAIFILTILQIIYGAFVAGLDAGMIYNQFPKMGEGIIPQEIYHSVNFWYDIINNPVMVQFIHRFIAISLIVMILSVGFYAYKINQTNEINLRYFKILIFLTFIQFSLGVFTLLTQVEILPAILHQLTALLLFANIIILKFDYKYLQRSI
jgi:heme a synthase